MKKTAPGIIALLLASTALFPVSLPAKAEQSSDSCYEKAADGTCLDQDTPTTGQYTTTPNPTNLPNLRSTQAHGAVRLTEATFVLAHNICRYVDNGTTHGKGVFIGLETKTEWTSFIAQPPAGANLAYCCQPTTVSICGVAKTLSFAKAGQSFTLTGGYNYQAVYTCGTGIAGTAPTVDTSWAVATSGQCAAPAAPSNDCSINLHVSADCQTQDDSETTPDHGTRGNHAGSNGDGPGNSGGHSDGTG